MKKKLMNKSVERSESAYDQFVESYEDTMVAGSADIGKSTIIVNSSAVSNPSPSGPNTLMNLIVAGFLSGVLALFVILMKYYWSVAE